MSTLCSLKVVLPSSSPGLRSGIASLSTALRGFATARQQTSSDIQAAVKTLMRDITAKENEDTGDADPLAVNKVVKGAKTGGLDEPIPLNRAGLIEAVKGVQPTLFDSAAASIVRKLCEIDAAIVSLENSTSTEGNGKVGRYTPGNGKTAAVITDMEMDNLLKAVTDSAIAVALGYSPVTLYCPTEVAELPRVLLAGRGVDILTKDVTADMMQNVSVISCPASYPRSRLFSPDDDVTSSTTKVQSLGRWSQGTAWMRLGRLFNRGNTTSKYELPLLAEDALTFLEPSGQKKLMEVLDETLDVIRSVANESGVIERTTAKDETRVRHLLLASPEPYDALVKTSVFDATMKELATTDNEETKTVLHYVSLDGEPIVDPAKSFSRFTSRSLGWQTITHTSYEHLLNWLNEHDYRTPEFYSTVDYNLLPKEFTDAVDVVNDRFSLDAVQLSSWYINDYLAGGGVVLDPNEMVRDITTKPQPRNDMFGGFDDATDPITDLSEFSDEDSGDEIEVDGEEKSNDKATQSDDVSDDANIKKKIIKEFGSLKDATPAENKE
ncbi:hypothetical protein Pmar_PMAR012692 [Perkinsus marinus ATCC 50983]|uniref:Uncharacterized protein n=1 Tax=Perkinsus marinus (strain ATCC 50983 / TXsc) TaxID=423536 RepID=C5K819_PERM5|nr:hypothetical protein Pmar_PMAR012692 [Perkinsus marinus ATCC 50983]EER19704.1 hypothetical protein Pmar_PMAR012692 [Perkinsus marinus ATCC 50983]|eukprot:XP_002787908.1 hypothetical protein Pmar_PMAR012692 [Perkinsus marinus ATCC 50983]